MSKKTKLLIPLFAIGVGLIIAYVQAPAETRRTFNKISRAGALWIHRMLHDPDEVNPIDEAALKAKADKENELLTSHTAINAKQNAEIFRVVRNDTPFSFDDNEFDFYSCNLTEVIKFLQKLAQTPNASEINMAFTKHITNALMKARGRNLNVRHLFL